ncbi:MAG: tetratricopeptide repeat protein [Gemmatimonadetes bacterium]|nr:tetratricopeptide repeat protein [Gemmatimonadota bacterium]
MNLLDLAKQHRKAGRLAESAATLQQAVMAAPMDPEVWFQGGTLAIKLKEFAFARTLFEMCARLVPTDAQAIYNVGYCSFRLGDPEAALAAYERAVAIDPAFVRAHIARGQLHYILGHPDEGRDAFDVALALPRPANAGDLTACARARHARRVRRRVGRLRRVVGAGAEPESRIDRRVGRPPRPRRHSLPDRRRRLRRHLVVHPLRRAGARACGTRRRCPGAGARPAPRARRGDRCHRARPLRAAQRHAGGGTLDLAAQARDDA